MLELVVGDVVAVVLGLARHHDDGTGTRALVGLFQGGGVLSPGVREVDRHSDCTAGQEEQD